MADPQMDARGIDSWGIDQRRTQLYVREGALGRGVTVEWSRSGFVLLPKQT